MLYLRWLPHSSGCTEETPLLDLSFYLVQSCLWVRDPGQATLTLNLGENVHNILCVTSFNVTSALDRMSVWYKPLTIVDNLQRLRLLPCTRARILDD